MTTLTDYARTGFDGTSNPHLFTSDAWHAHELGRHFQNSGRPVPRDVRMGRGNSIRASDMRFTIAGGQADPTFERVE